MPIRHVALRVSQTALTLLIASLALFFLIRAVPGDPAAIRAGLDASPEAIEAIREELRLNDPMPVQYVAWITNVVQGDFGDSITYREPVLTTLGRTLLPTALLLVSAMAIAIPLGVIVGVVASARARTWLDNSISGFSALTIGIPPFWLGLLAILVFSLYLDWFPAGGWVDPFEDPLGAMRSVTLPALVLALALGGVLARFVRSAMLDTLNESYVTTARAKGASETRAIWRHAFRNTLIPVLTVIGIQFGRLLGGAVVVEAVFAWPGVGRLLVTAVGNRDYPLIQGGLLILILAVAITNLAIDLLYPVVDPRVRGSTQ